MVATVMGCGGVFEDEVATGQPIVEGFYGGVAGDDPRPVLVARDILAGGGSAADAAIAYYFMSAVSLPATNSLGGGGVCIAYDEGNNKTELIDFRTGSTGGTMSSWARPTALPGAVRGMYALYARAGALPWSDLIVPAERAARFGIPVSRALATDLALVGDALLEDPAAQAIFGGADGQVLEEGDQLVQFDLAGMLSLIRGRGAGDFYLGLSATQFLDGVAGTGVNIPPQNLRDFAPHWRATARRGVPWGIFGSEALISVPPKGFDAGPIALWSWDMLKDGGRLAAAQDAGLRAHLLAEVALRGAVARAIAPLTPPEPGQADQLMASYSHQAATSPAALPAPPETIQESPAVSGFVTVDSLGGAVACTVTLNNLFGNGRVAPGTGIVLAAEPGPQRGNGLTLLPVLVVNENAREVIFAGTATGGVAAAPVLATILAEVMEGKRELVPAVTAGRAFDPGDPDVVVVEPGIGDEAVQGLLARGHDVRTVPELARVHAISCPEGLRNGSGSCRFVTDPRGFGLAVGG